MRRLRLRIAPLLAAIVIAACSDATAPQPLVVEIRTVNFTTPAEAAAWPTTPTVEGGATIRVRGSTYLGCLTPLATAQRRGKRIDVAITVNDTQVYCVGALVAVSPAFEATVKGMDPGEYLVHVTVEGLAGSAEWVVTVTSGEPLMSLR